jgi:hypothetical protein
MLFELFFSCQSIISVNDFKAAIEKLRALRAFSLKFTFDIRDKSGFMQDQLVHDYQKASIEYCF